MLIIDPTDSSRMLLNVADLCSLRYYETIQKKFSVDFAVKKRRGQRATRDVAHLQAHETCKTSQRWPSTHTPTQVPARYLCVSTRPSFI